MKKMIVMLCTCVLLCAGCAAMPENLADTAAENVQTGQENVTLFDTDTVEIVLEGTETHVTDKNSGNEYTFTTTRKISTQTPTLEQMQAKCLGRTAVETDTLKIELAGGLIVVHDKFGEQTYYINR